MKIRQPSNKAKTLLITGVVVTIAIIGLGYYVVGVHGSIIGWTPYPNKDSSDTHPATQEQINSGTQIKQRSLSDDKTKSRTSGTDQPPAPIPQSGSKGVVQVTITAANQTSTTLQLRSLISILDATGICTLTLQKQSSSNPSISDTAGVQLLANTTTCKGFDIPLSKLSVGTWQATLSFDSAQFTGSTSQTITIK